MFIFNERRLFREGLLVLRKSEVADITSNVHRGLNTLKGMHFLLNSENETMSLVVIIYVRNKLSYDTLFHGENLSSIGHYMGPAFPSSKVSVTN